MPAGAPCAKAWVPWSPRQPLPARVAVPRPQSRRSAARPPRRPRRGVEPARRRRPRSESGCGSGSGSGSAIGSGGGSGSVEGRRRLRVGDRIGRRLRVGRADQAAVADRRSDRAAVAGRWRGQAAVAGRWPALRPPPDFSQRSGSPTPRRPQARHTPSRGRRKPQSPPFDANAPLLPFNEAQSGATTADAQRLISRHSRPRPRTRTYGGDHYHRPVDHASR